MHQASVLYESIAGLDGLRQLVVERATENLFLEFKTKKNDSIPDLDGSDSWQFSRALSGFANSDGGVVVWGVETDKDERASKLRPIASVADFVSRLKKSLINSVQPFVDDVRIEAILEVGRTGAGYVKVLVPRSEKTPHRALLAGREYYRRSTEGFYKLEHFDLEDAFGRRPRPVLTLRLDLIPRIGEDPHEEVSFDLQNEGRGIARFIGLMCEFSSDVQVVANSRGFQDLARLNKGRPIVSYTDNTGVLHPVNVMTNIGTVIIRRAIKGTPLSFSVRWYCAGMTERSFSGNVSPENQQEQTERLG